MNGIIGRKKEIEEFDKLWSSGRSEFLAVYGRRRVGKTFLIKQALNQRITFQHTGVSPVDQDGERKRMKIQLESFYYTMLSYGLEGFKKPQSWLEAFFQLEQLLLKLDNGGRQVVFFDELPWMDTPKSGFLPAFESFWNGWCNGRNVMLVVCGSATSWIMTNLSRNRGGLYGRLTCEMKIKPFTLKECEEYFESQNITMSRYDIVRSYMVFGGIPYYLGYFDKGQSFEGNTDRILFVDNPRLKDEFNRLFNAAFSNPGDCKAIIRLLATRNSGFTREEIASATKIPFGGGLTATLAALAESDFVERYTPYNSTKGLELYKLSDNFCLFWLKYVEPQGSESAFMTESVTTDIFKTWSGVAFEEVCRQHIQQIKRALEIGGVKSSVSAYNVKGDDYTEGAQIDLLIHRADNVVNLCEMKFSSKPYAIDKDEEARLRHRIEVIKSTISPKQTIHLTFITTYGISYGRHSGIVQKQVVMDDLFA